VLRERSVSVQQDPANNEPNDKLSQKVVLQKSAVALVQFLRVLVENTDNARLNRLHGARARRPHPSRDLRDIRDKRKGLQRGVEEERKQRSDLGRVFDRAGVLGRAHKNNKRRGKDFWHRLDYKRIILKP
jgi:hypothetical protein